MAGRFRLFALFPLLLALAGCVERSPAPPGPSDPIGPIFGSRAATQTFLAAPLALVGLKVQLATYNRRNAGELVVRLRGTSGGELRTLRVEAASLEDNRFREFRFEPIQLASDEPLVFSIESTALDEENAITVWATAGDVVRGQATYDGVPRDVDLVFTPIYAEPIHEAVGVQLLRLVADFPAPLSTAGTLLVPGFLLSSLFVRRSTHGLALQLAAAPAFGISATALLALYATVVGLPLNRGSVGLAAAAAVILLVGLVVIRRRPASRVPSLESRAGAAPDPRPETRDTRPETAALLAAAAASILMRAIALEDGPAPPGADTYHHVLITQLILDRGGIPTSYEPYAPIQSFSYHFGVHSLAAFTALLAGRPALEAVAAVAPLLNGMLCLSVYFLARAGGLDGMAALVAAVGVAVVDPLSMQLLDIGRYPQSGGLLVLPVALAFALGMTGRGAIDRAQAAMNRAPTWEQLRPVAGGGVLAAGLFLTHYRVAIFLAAIVALRLCWEIVRPALRKAQGRPHWADRGVRPYATGVPVAVGGVAILLVLPWLVRLWQEFTLGVGGSGGRYAPQYYALDRVADALAHPGLAVLLVGALLGLGLAIRNRQPLLTLLGVWALAQLALSNPYWVPLPGVGYVDTVTVVSSLFLPASLLAGYAVSHLPKGYLRLGTPPPPPLWGRRLFPPPLWGRVRVGGRTAIPTTFALALVGAAAWGALQLPQLIQPAHRVLREGDLAAVEWIERSTPTDARFLVNAFVLEWQPDFVAPTDGGYWLPLLARRQTTLLPMVYPAERGAPAPGIESMERITRAVQRDPAAPETLALLRAAKVTHLYLGVRRGPISEPKVAASGAYRRTFHAGGVSVYEVVSR